MQKLEGKKVFDGVAFGRVAYYGKKERKVKRSHIENAGNEIQF